MAKKCPQCEGRGTYRTYSSGVTVCDDCEGAGFELTLDQREIIEAVMNAIEARRVAGWGKP